MEKYALMENGYIHTEALSLKDAEEMLERYERIFPDMDWFITDKY
jgi:hypothetical protein